MNIKITSLLIVLLWLLLPACGGEEEPPSRDGSNLNTVGHPAIDAITEKIARKPGDPALYAARAELFYENEGYDEAIRDLTKALSLDSLNVDYYHLLADAYLDYYRSQKALETMERAAEIFPERIPTLLKLSEFQFILKQYEASMHTIDRILKIDPQNEDAYFMFGMNFKETGDTARAVNSFQQAVELNPDLIDAWINLGKLHAALGNSIAAQYYDSALEIAPDNIMALHAKAEYLTDQDKLPEAIELYRRINRIDPQYDEAFYNAGLLYMELDSLEQAYRHFDLAIKTYPAHVRAYFYRGLAAEWLGRTQQARNDYQQALRLAPDYELPKQRLEELREVN
jgi:tetratricopeptide (TPR) repeat protein